MVRTKNFAPGIVAKVLSPPGTRSLPGAFFLPSREIFASKPSRPAKNLEFKCSPEMEFELSWASMIEARQLLTFSTEPWLIGLSIAVCFLTLGLSYFSWQRSGFARPVLWLEALRCLIVWAGAFLLNQPEWVQEFRSEEKPALVVLADASESMKTVDVLLKNEGRLQGAVSRAEAIAGLQTSGAWNSFQSRMDVRIQSFPSGVSEGTDLNSALNEVLDSSQRVLAVVLASDGDWNTGQSPMNAALRYRTQGIPILTIPVGAPTRLPDIELLSVDTPTFGIVNKAVRIPFTIESALPRDHVFQVSLQASDGERITKEVRVAAMARTTDFSLWTPKTEGDFTLTVEVPNHPDEVIPGNNSLSTPITIRSERLKVLVIDSFPRWEYRYLRNALSRDPGVEVACLLFHPVLDKMGGGNKDYIKEFPSGMDELSKFDVVFVGDIGMDHLTKEQCKLLRGLVEHQASGLVFMPGWQGKQHSLAESDLEALMPVTLDPSQPYGFGSKTPMKFELTEAGRRSLLTKLADTQDDNLEAWENLPGFQWYAPVFKAKAGTEVLAVHQEMSNEYGRIPLLVTKTFGAGKVLFMGTDGAWRWRRGVEDKYHYRFWGQVVRWMAYQRNMAKGETMRFYFAPDQPSIGQTLALRANVMENSGEPLTSGEVTARIEAPSGKFKTVRMASGGTDSWGSFEGRYEVEEPGSHRVILTCKQTGALLETTFYVQGSSKERIGLAARPKVLEELSKFTSGSVLPLNDMAALQSIVGNIPDPPSLLRRFQLWSHPWTIVAMITALSVFWIGRKWVGLI